MKGFPNLHVLLILLSIKEAVSLSPNAFSMECTVGGFMKILSTEATSGYIMILDDSCSLVELTSDDMTTYFVNIDCHTIVPDEQFIFFWSETNENLKPTFYSGICYSDYDVTATVSEAASASILSTLTTDLEGELEIQLSSNTPTLGDAFTITISLTAESQVFYVMLLTTATLSYDGSEADIVEIGNLLSGVDFQVCDGQRRSTNRKNTYILLKDETIVLGITVTVDLCLIADTGSCAPTAICPDGMLDYGRKRRQDGEGLTASAKTTIVAFSRQGSMQQFKERMRQELGLAEASSEDTEGNICVNKTTSAVILVILIVGMAICLMATCWMFVKLRKSRRAKTPAKSDVTFSNRSLKY